MSAAARRTVQPKESDYAYSVTSPGGVPMMRTEYEQYRYPPETELQMLDAGYRITINGRRLTKKAAAERLQNQTAKGGKSKQA